MGRRIDPAPEKDFKDVLLGDTSEAVSARTSLDEILYRIAGFGALLSFVVMLLGTAIAAITEPNDWRFAAIGIGIYITALLFALTILILSAVRNKMRI